jgi:hypothetical protein
VSVCVRSFAYACIPQCFVLCVCARASVLVKYIGPTVWCVCVCVLVCVVESILGLFCLFIRSLLSLLGLF